ncbi:MAG: right-handed parallel beta-helix repeat-containing protein [Acidimicrobiales bacterium]
MAPEGDDAGDGSTDRPLRTIQRALDLAGPGTTVVLAPGVYMQDFRSRRPGLPTAPITITGPPEAVVKGGGEGHVIEIRHDHTVLSGFTVDGLHGDPATLIGYRSKLVWIQGENASSGVSGVRVRSMRITNAQGECVRLRYFAHDNEVADSNITNCGVDDFRFAGGGKNGEAIYIGTAPEQRDNGTNATGDVDRSNDNRVHRNTIDTAGNECVDVKEGASGNVVEANSCTGQLDPDSAGLDSRGNGNVFRHNTIFGNVGAGIRLGGDGPSDGTGNDVYSNVIRDNRAGGVKFMRKPQGRVCGNQFSATEKESAGDFAKDFRPERPCP